MKNYYVLLISLLIICLDVFSQEADSAGDSFPESSFELRGYISNMQSVMIYDIDDQWVNDNLFHNRLNFFLYSGGFTGSVQFRNRFMYGQTIYMNPGYTKGIDAEDNFLDLSLNIFSGNSYFLNSSIDRLYLQYTAGNFVFTGGRQRINWGQTMVWNPNDVFNIQNYFDFDYPEKPGSDAVRIQYYPGYTSTIELAAKLDQNSKLTAAGYYKFNKWGYDIQFLAGLLSETDVFAGLGWAGDIQGAGFRGEFSYFQPKENFNDTSGLLISSVSIDYTFSNSLYLQFESLYNEMPENGGLDNFYEFYQGNLNVKNMSFSEWNFFVQASYPFTPLLNGSISLMYFPDLEGIYSGPSINYSLTNNSQLSVISQIFDGEFINPFSPELTAGKRTTLFFGFVRYKFNF